MEVTVSPPRPSPRAIRLAALLVVACASATVFWRTAYPTITWWDSSNYSLAAATLGVTTSPGSLLLTLLGWVVTRVSSSLTVAYRLNLLAGALAATTVALVYLVALRLWRLSDPSASGRERFSASSASSASTIGAAIGALSFAFSTTLWEYAVMFTPYVLTAVFTGLVLLTMMRWWEDADRPDAWRWIALLALLIGLDFSVHRTNALLIPGVLVWVLLRHPRTLLEPRAWLAGAAALALGLSAQLLVIPVAIHTRAPYSMLEPTNWSRFWSYVSLAQVGGGFLLDVWPRKAPFWSVQVADFLRVLRENFVYHAASTWMLDVLPALAAALGLLALWRRNRRLAVALALVLLVQAIMTVVYFNIPANYFRSLDRHYLPVCVTIAVLVACGAGEAMRYAARVAREWRWTGSTILAAAVIGVVALMPAAQLVGNWRTHDASKRWFTRDFAVNLLANLPPRALLFTVGDNDTFPLFYVQTVEGVRPDVRVVNLSLANAPWYIRQVVRRDPSFPISRATVAAFPAVKTASLDTSVAIPIRATAEQLALPRGTAVPASITIKPAPRVGSMVLPADIVLLDIVRTNAWRDPLCFAATAGHEGMGWLAPYARQQGLQWCTAPVAGVGVDRDLLRANLSMHYHYRGYADSRVIVDDVARTMGSLYLIALRDLLDADVAAGAIDACRDDMRRLLAAVPPERIGWSAQDRAELEARCGR